MVYTTPKALLSFDDTHHCYWSINIIIKIPKIEYIINTEQHIVLYIVVDNTLANSPDHL